MNLSDALVAPPPLTSLKRLSIQGTAVSVFAQILRFAVQLAGTAVLARLLSPQDFGVVGMVTVATGILYLFSDPGYLIPPSSAKALRRRKSPRSFGSTSSWDSR